jgi:hypothetical protein
LLDSFDPHETQPTAGVMVKLGLKLVGFFVVISATCRGEPEVPRCDRDGLRF